MARDSSLYVRRAGLRLLSESAPLVALVSGRMYPPQRPANPVWPFLAWGAAVAVPFEASGMDGAAIDFAVHAYAATVGTGGSTISGEERAQEIASLAARVLVEAGEVSLAGTGCPYVATAHFTWQQTQVVQDGAEADAFHAFATIRANVTS